MAPRARVKTAATKPSASRRGSAVSRVKESSKRRSTKSRAEPEDDLLDIVEVTEEVIPEAAEPVRHEPVRDALYFDRQWYLEAYPDVAEAGVDPATHYRTAGFREGRQPNALFNSEAYLAVNPDLAGYEDDLFLHYVFFGAAEGRPLAP